MFLLCLHAQARFCSSWEASIGILIMLGDPSKLLCSSSLLLRLSLMLKFLFTISLPFWTTWCFCKLKMIILTSKMVENICGIMLYLTAAKNYTGNFVDSLFDQIILPFQINPSLHFQICTIFNVFSKYFK